jgi:hypothetical protein
MTLHGVGSPKGKELDRIRGYFGRNPARPVSDPEEYSAPKQGITPTAPRQGITPTAPKQGFPRPYGPIQVPSVETPSGEDQGGGSWLPVFDRWRSSGGGGWKKLRTEAMFQLDSAIVPLNAVSEFLLGSLDALIPRGVKGNEELRELSAETRRITLDFFAGKFDRYEYVARMSANFEQRPWYQQLGADVLTGGAGAAAKTARFANKVIGRTVVTKRLDRAINDSLKVSPGPPREDIVHPEIVPSPKRPEPIGALRGVGRTRLEGLNKEIRVIAKRDQVLIAKIRKSTGSKTKLYERQLAKSGNKLRDIEAQIVKLDIPSVHKRKSLDALKKIGYKGSPTVRRQMEAFRRSGTVPADGGPKSLPFPEGTSIYKGTPITRGIPFELTYVVRNLHDVFLQGKRMTLKTKELAILAKFLRVHGVGWGKDPNVGQIIKASDGARHQVVMGAYDNPHFPGSRSYITWTPRSNSWSAQIGVEVPANSLRPLYGHAEFDKLSGLWEALYGPLGRRTSRALHTDRWTKFIKKEEPVRRSPDPPQGSELPEPRAPSDKNIEAAAGQGITPSIDGVVYTTGAYGESAERLLQSDSHFWERLRKIPGLREIAGVWNTAQIRRTDPVVMVGLRKRIFEETEHGRARYSSLLLWNEMKPLFGFKDVGGVQIVGKRVVGAVRWEATKVRVLSTAAKRTLDDILDNSELYALTPEQQRVLDIGMNTQTAQLRQMQSLNVDAVELGTNYWHRIVITGPRERTAGSWIEGRLKQRPGFTLHRAFEKVDDAGTGYKYETHPLVRLQARLDAGIDTISSVHARRELAEVPKVEAARLLSKYPDTVAGMEVARNARNRAKDNYKADLSTSNGLVLQKTEAELVEAKDNVLKAKRGLKQRVVEDSYELRLNDNRVVPSELRDEIAKWVDLPELRAGGNSVKAVEDTFAMIRSVVTTADLAAGFIQGQTLFFRNNPAWWRGMGQSILALVDDPTAYVARNYEILDEGTRLGAIGSPTEFMFTAGKIRGAPTRIPIIGRGLKSFNRAFEWFILVGQTELYKAARMGVTQGGKSLDENGVKVLVDQGKAIRRMMGTESYAILGIRPTQQTVETLLFFAARFARANIGLMGQSFGTGPGAVYARKAMGSLIGGSAALVIAGNWGLYQRAPNFTDPFKPDWMAVPIGTGYLSPLGPFYSYFKTLARMGIYAEKGEYAKGVREMKNFLNGKASIAIRTADIMGQFLFTGSARDFEGEERPFTASGVAGAVMQGSYPIAAKDIVKGFQEGRPEAVLAIIGLTLRASPWAQMDILFKRQADINPTARSYSEAQAHEKDIMKERFPEIAEALLKRGFGMFGEASREWDKIDTRIYQLEEYLESELAAGTLVNLKDFRDQLRKLQFQRATEKESVNREYNLFQELDALPEDPQKRAVAEYFRAFTEAKLPSGILDWELLGDKLDWLHSQWTEDQKKSVEINTGRTLHPKVITEYLADMDKLDDYFKIPRTIIGDDLVLREEYKFHQEAAGIPFAQSRPRRKSSKLNWAIRRIGEEKRHYRRRNPWAQGLLEKWGLVQSSP